MASMQIQQFLSTIFRKLFKVLFKQLANCPQTKKIVEKVTTFLQKPRFSFLLKNSFFFVEKLNSICEKIFHLFFIFSPCCCGVKIHLKEPIINTNPWTIPNKCVMPSLTSLELHDTKFIESFKINQHESSNTGLHTFLERWHQFKTRYLFITSLAKEL